MVDYKRIHPRVDVELEAELYPPVQETQPCTVRNISQGGMFVICEEKLAIGMICSFAVQLPENLSDRAESIRGSCEVVWNRSASLKSGTLSGMGLKFLSLPEADKQRLLTLVEQQQTTQTDQPEPDVQPDGSELLGTQTVELKDVSEDRAADFDLDDEDDQTEEESIHQTQDLDPPASQVTIAKNPFQEQRTSPRVLLGYKVKMKFENLEDFIEDYAINISAGGMFIRTTKTQPTGSQLQFEILLKDDTVAMKGIGEVVWKAPPPRPGDKPRVPGFGLRFVNLDQHSQALVQQIIDRGLTKSGEPIPVPQPGPRSNKLTNWPQVKKALVQSIELAGLFRWIDRSELKNELQSWKPHLYKDNTVRLGTLFAILLSQPELDLEKAALPIMIFFLQREDYQIQIELPEMIEMYEGQADILAQAKALLESDQQS